VKFPRKNSLGQLSKKDFLVIQASSDEWVLHPDFAKENANSLIKPYLLLFKN